jgi:hypothetical protein
VPQTESQTSDLTGVTDVIEVTDDLNPSTVTGDAKAIQGSNDPQQAGSHTSPVKAIQDQDTGDLPQMSTDWPEGCPIDKSYLGSRKSFAEILKEVKLDM